MQLPYFFQEIIPLSGNFFLSQESSKHIVQVLRMKGGEEINITNGNGELLSCFITTANKIKTEVTITKRLSVPKSNQKISIAISLIKNNNRLEWFLEKVTEIGVSEIIPFISERTEKQYFNHDRMKKILVSAMLQSQQAWLPLLYEPVKFKELIKKSSFQNKYIAHCLEGQKKQLSHEANQHGDQLILIGPEGDFTKSEIDAAIVKNYIPVSLGDTRLRTETAGIVAAVLFLNK